MQDGETVLIETHQVQQRGVHVAHRDLGIGGPDREVVRLTELGSRLDVPSGHPDHEPVLVVVATGLIRGQIVVKWCRDPFRTPRQRVCRPTIRAISGPSRVPQRAIDFFAMDWQTILDRAVIVPPVAAGAVQHFYKTNPTFHHAPREQALTSKMLGSRIIQAV